MQQSTIPGYSEIFPVGEETYEQLVKCISSDTLLKLCAAINNELTCPEERPEIQGRLNFNVIARFTIEQKELLFDAFKVFKTKAKEQFQGMIFFRRYLIAMILKELNNYREVDAPDDLPIHEFNFIKAYLMIIDEVNQGDHGDIDFRALDRNDPSTEYKLSWLPSLRQFEYNERGNIIFDTLKIACLLKYAATSYQPYLKEYLKLFNFKNPGELLNSYNQIYGVTQIYDPKEMFRKYSLIDPIPGVNTLHLESQTINSQIGKKLSFSDLKKHSIFFSKQRGKYIILDNYLSQRKIFRGPYFELYHSTSLKLIEKKKSQAIFNKYSQDVADVLEKTCLCPILTMLGEETCNILHFDDGSDSVPDGYLRIGQKIFLFEYKAYFFPERYSQKPDYDELKKYFDERFICNEKGKEKGINQLKKQIKLIFDGDFSFDPELKEILKTQKVIVYPIITYNDFNFSLPGLNVYLHHAFTTILGETFSDKLNIMPLTLINLESILDMVMTEQGISGLEKHIINYFTFLNQWDMSYQITKKTDDWLKTRSSFDEIYNWLFIQKLDEPNDIKPVLERLLALAGISFDELNQPLI